MEKKCSQQKPSCEDACAAKAKAGAKDNCKKDDKECLAKFKKMAAKCVEEKCKGTVLGGFDYKVSSNSRLERYSVDSLSLCHMMYSRHG